MRFRTSVASVVAIAACTVAVGGAAPSAAVGPSLHEGDHDDGPTVRLTATPVEPAEHADHSDHTEHAGDGHDTHADAEADAGGNRDHSGSPTSVSGTARASVLGGFGVVNAAALATAFVMRLRGRRAGPSRSA